LLMEVGLVREECRIGNVMRVRPPNDDFGYFYVDRQKRIPKQALIDGIAFLKEDIKRCNPNVVVALGNEALKALTGKSGIMNWRGSILFNRKLGCKIVPTVRPAALLRAWNNIPLVMFDFKRVKAESETADYSLRNRELVVRPLFETVMWEIDRLKTVKRVSVDVETNEDGHITAIALAESPWKAISIPFTNSSGAPYWRVEEEIAIWEAVKVVLEDEGIEKIAQNAQFDILMFSINPYHIEVKGLVLDTMCAHHTVYPEMAASETQATGKHRIGGGKSLGLLCSIYTRQPYYKHWRKSGNDEMFWKYNAMDAAVTYEIADVLEREMKEFGVYDFYYKLVHPLIPILMEMQIRGVRIDQAVRVQAKEMYEKETVELQSKLDQAIGKVINVMSPKQLKELLYDDLNLPPQYKKGTTSLTTNEEALENLSNKYNSPIFDLILRIRENRKLIGTYLDEGGGKDGRIRCSYVIGGTETGRLSSRESVFGYGCLLPDAEVLTFNGWTKIKEIQNGDEVMQWEPNGRLSFCAVTTYKTLFEGEMLEADADFHRNVYTPEHRIPYISHHTNKITTRISDDIKVVPAKVLASFNNEFLPVSGYYNGTKHSDIVRVAVMVQADGTVERRGYIRIAFKKEAKIERCKKLLDDCGADYYEVSAPEGYKRFAIVGKVAEEVYNMIGPNKEFGSWIFFLDNENLKEIIDELPYWDGMRRNRSFCYFTGKEVNAAVVSTIAHLCGYSASVRKVPSKTFASIEEQKVIPGKFIYTVSIKPRAYVMTGKRHFRPYPYKGEVYCVTTQSSFFLTRFRGRISVTGNTNLQNIPKGVCRRMFVADDGKVFIEADLSQAEARVVAYLSEEERLVRLFEEGKDIHKYVASWIFNKSVEEVTTGGKESEREIAKHLIHASNYGIGPRTFAKVAGVSEKEAKRLLERYFDTFPNIRAWHLKTQAQLERSRTMTTPMGRKRTFFGIWGDTLFREAYSYVPQSTVADILNLALIRFNGMLLDEEIMLQVHDAFVVQTYKESVQSTVRRLKEAFNIPVYIGGKTLVIPVEMKMGENWQDMTKIG